MSYGVIILILECPLLLKLLQLWHYMVIWALMHLWAGMLLNRSYIMLIKIYLKMEYHYMMPFSTLVIFVMQLLKMVASLLVLFGIFSEDKLNL